MQFIICLAAPENSKRIEYLNSHEAFITFLTQTLQLVRNYLSVKAFSMWNPVNIYSNLWKNLKNSDEIHR